MAQAPPSDHAVMADPLWQQAQDRAIREAFSQDVEGWLAESLALITRWDDIDVAAIRTSLVWYHGPHDRNAPLSAAQRLVARIPSARLVVWPEAGHFETYHREAEVLDELLART